MKSIKIILSLIIFLTTSFSYATSAPSENIRCGQEAYCSTAQVIADFNFLKSKKVNKKSFRHYANQTGEGLVILGTSTFLISVAHQLITNGSIWNYMGIRIGSLFVTAAGGFIMLATHSDQLADGTMTSYLATDAGLSTLMLLDSEEMIRNAQANYLIAEKVVSLANLIRITESEKN